MLIWLGVIVSENFTEDDIAYKECCNLNLVHRIRQEFAMKGSTEYRAILKGRGFVYAYDSQLYRQVKKVGRVRYLKCTIAHCDGSTKLDNGQITTVMTRVHLANNILVHIIMLLFKSHPVYRQLKS